MTHKEFDKFQNELLNEVRKMKDTKGKEYANSNDRFGNFNRLSARLGVPNIVIGWIYLTKHLDSIESYIKRVQEGENQIDIAKGLAEPIKGRFIDALTYLTLISGMIEEVITNYCDNCKGTGGFVEEVEIFKDLNDPMECSTRTTTCPKCQGTGLKG